MKNFFKVLILVLFIPQAGMVFALDSVILQPEEVYFLDLSDSHEDVADAANLHSKISDTKKNSGITYFEETEKNFIEKTEEKVSDFVKNRVRDNKINIYILDIKD